MSDKDKDNIWAAIMSSERPHMIVPLPRNKPGTQDPICEIAMVVLTAEESALITADAEKKVRRILKDNIPQHNEAKTGYDNLYNQFVAEGLLFTSCKNKDNLKQSFFPKKEDVLQVFTTDELAILLNHYYTVQATLGPVISHLDESEFEYWINKITEAATRPDFLLNSFSQAPLIQLVIYMAKQLKN